MPSALPHTNVTEVLARSVTSYREQEHGVVVVVVVADVSLVLSFVVVRQSSSFSGNIRRCRLRVAAATANYSHPATKIDIIRAFVE